MISVNDFKTGVTVELDGAAYQVVDFQHVKPGKGAAFVRAKLKNLQTGATVERTFRGGEKISKAHVDRREMQYLYNDGQDYICMDNENYEQISISKSQIGDGVKWLLENMNIYVLIFQGNIIGLELPNFVELRVTETEPGIKETLLPELPRMLLWRPEQWYKCHSLLKKEMSCASIPVPGNTWKGLNKRIAFMVRC